MAGGKSVRLFLADGSPGGLLTAEIMNWTGHVLAAPRSELGELLARVETSRTGIYLLLGDDPESLGGTSAYIGEADEVRARLRSHAREKDFWERAIVLTSKDSNLTKAHARYLESRLISLAQDAKRSTLTNVTSPPVIALPEADVSDMEYFISQAMIVLPVLGVNLFRSRRPPAPSPVQDATVTTGSATSPIFEYRVFKHDILARAQQIDGEFTVLEGSTARDGWNASPERIGYRPLQAKLEEDGTLERIPGTNKRRFTHDQTFASPSAAAAIVVGHAANGRKAWISATGETFGEWQAHGLDADPTVI